LWLRLEWIASLFPSLLIHPSLVAKGNSPGNDRYHQEDGGDKEGRWFGFGWRNVSFQFNL
jgi:hypothetical protein